jgi:hypothetical protein
MESMLDMGGGFAVGGSDGTPGWPVPLHTSCFQPGTLACLPRTNPVGRPHRPPARQRSGSSRYPVSCVLGNISRRGMPSASALLRQFQSEPWTGLDSLSLFKSAGHSGAVFAPGRCALPLPKLVVTPVTVVTPWLGDWEVLRFTSLLNLDGGTT